jgi:hypothetical protein
MILPDFSASIQKRLLERLVTDYVRPDGRVILGPWDEYGMEDAIREWGFQISGYCEKSFPNKPYRFRRFVWIDGPNRESFWGPDGPGMRSVWWSAECGRALLFPIPDPRHTIPASAYRAHHPLFSTVTSSVSTAG